MAKTRRLEASLSGAASPVKAGAQPKALEEEEVQHEEPGHAGDTEEGWRSGSPVTKRNQGCP